MPSLADRPPSGTAAEVRRNYSSLPAWWLRPVLVYVALFMTIVPPEVLRRQRAAVTAWIDEVLEASQRDRAIRLGDSFAERDVISGVEIFGEPMRGVWVWREPSIMPHLYLGWALADPRTAETFDESDAVFLRRTPKSLRRRSRLEHQG